jgi:hypothetical protein
MRSKAAGDLTLAEDLRRLWAYIAKHARVVESEDGETRHVSRVWVEYLVYHFSKRGALCDVPLFFVEVRQQQTESNR